MQLVEERNLAYSVALHAAVLFFALVGLPAILPPHTDPLPLVMSVEILPITDVTNVKPSDKAIQKEQHAPTPKTPKVVPPSMVEKPKESAPEKPAEKTEKAPDPDKHFDPMEGAKPDKAKEEEKPKDKPADAPKPAEEDFAALLNKLKQENQTAPKDSKDKTNTEENKTKSDAPYDASKPLSISERDSIRSQFIPCWRPALGAKDASTLVVRVRVELLQDGTVKTATLASDQQSRYGSDPFFRAAADAALRAVHKCSPLKNLPADKFGTWKDMEITFDPKDMAL